MMHAMVDELAWNTILGSIQGISFRVYYHFSRYIKRQKNWTYKSENKFQLFAFSEQNHKDSEY
jgi:hypothetical protein